MTRLKVISNNWLTPLKRKLALALGGAEPSKYPLSNRDQAQLLTYPLFCQLNVDNPTDFPAYLDRLTKSLNTDACALSVIHSERASDVAKEKIYFSADWQEPDNSVPLNRYEVSNSKAYQVYLMASSTPANHALLEAAIAELARFFKVLEYESLHSERVIWAERANISTELHDSLAQSLSYLRIQTTHLRHQLKDTKTDSSVWTDALGEIEKQLALAYRQLRELMTTFRLTLNGKRLDEAVRTTLDDLTQRSTLVVYSDIRIANATLSAIEELQVLQIVREGLSNVVRHAQADTVHLRLVFENNMFELELRDDGKGLSDQANPEQQYGIVIMQERAARLNAEFDIDNIEPVGTRLRLTFRLKAGNLDQR